VHDGFVVTLWIYYEGVPSREVAPAEYARALTRLHAGMRQIDMATPRSGKTTLLALANATVGNEPFAFAGASLFDRASEGLFSRATWSDAPLVCLDELPIESLRSEETFKQMAAHSGVAQRQMWARETTSNL
jgi:hypothetical protein